MGMDAELMAIGSYDTSVAECLEYPPSWYERVDLGAVVFSSLFHCPTSDASRKLAACFGIDNPCDLGKALVDVAQVRRADLIELADEIGSSEDVTRLDRLAAAGFTFYYRPNA